MTIAVSKIDAGQEPLKVSRGDSMKVLHECGNLQTLRNVAQKECLHLMTSGRKCGENIKKSP